MEAAAELALLTGACRYRSIASILKNSLDRQPPGRFANSTPGHVIGSYSCSHLTRMAALTRSEMDSEWRESLPRRSRSSGKR